MPFTFFKYNRIMNSKKIWSLLLLLAISFSISHDYTFSALDKHSSSIETYLGEFSHVISNKHADKLCDIHFEYHTQYIFEQNTISFSQIEYKPLFAYEKIFYSLNYFNFFKPPIA